MFSGIRLRTYDDVGATGWSPFLCGIFDRERVSCCCEYQCGGGEVKDLGTVPKYFSLFLPKEVCHTIFLNSEHLSEYHPHIVELCRRYRQAFLQVPFREVC